MKKELKHLCIVGCVVLTLTGCSLQPANRNYKKAVSAYDNGEYEEAETYFKKAIEGNEDKAEYYIDYGFNLIQMGRYEEALKQFDRVIMDNDITMVKENNKKAYRGKGIAYLRMNQYTEALEAFDLALEITELKSLDEDLLFYKGQTLEYEGQYEKGIEIYTELIEKNDKDASLYSARANLYRKMGEYDASLADYEKALSYEKSNFDLYFGKFSVLKELGKNEEASSTLEEAANITVNSEKDKFNLAKVHFYQENYEVAKSEFQTAISDGFTEANYFLGEISMAEKNYKEALTYYDAYESAGNTLSAMYYNQRLVCYLNLEDYTNAAKALKQAKTYSTASIAQQLLRNEIVLLEKTGDFTNALNKMEAYMKEYTVDEETKKDYEFLKTRVTTQSEDSSDKNSDTSETKENENTTVEKP